MAFLERPECDRAGQRRLIKSLIDEISFDERYGYVVHKQYKLMRLDEQGVCQDSNNHHQSIHRIHIN